MRREISSAVKGQTRKPREHSCLSNAAVQISRSGHWLIVTTIDGKTAGCCLENLGIGLGAEDVFVQWAEEQKSLNRKD